MPWIALFLVTGTTAIIISTNMAEFCTSEGFDLGKWVKCKYTNGGRLQYIPKMVDVTSLEFIGHNLSYITRETFRNLTKCDLKSLSLVKNDIKYISTNAFSQFESLFFLDLGFNDRVSLVALRESFFSLNLRENATLILSGLGLTDRDITKLFSKLKTNNIRHLSLANNNLSALDSCYFKKFSRLNSLLLSNNRIKTIDFFCKLSTNSLILENNQLAVIPKFCMHSEIFIHLISMESAVPELVELDIRKNHISIISPMVGKCTPNLKKINLFENPIQRIASRSFESLENLTEILLSSCNTQKPGQRYHISFEALSFSSFSLARIFLSNFSLIKNPSQNVFDELPNLTTLDLSLSELPEDDQSLKKLFKPLSNVSELFLSGMSWTKFPCAIFTSVPNLHVVDLSYNYIKEINLSCIKTASNLKYMDISNNPFNCSCKNSKLFVGTFLQSLVVDYNISLKNYPDDYICKSPPSKQGKIVTEVVCQSSFVVVVFSILVTVVACGSIVVVAFRTRFYLKFWLYKLSRSLTKWPSNQLCYNSDAIFDGFVIFSEHDKPWIMKHLLKFLEEKHNFRLCLHNRDFEYGRLIHDNIIENMGKSRKILLVLSNNLAQSKWCKFEVLLAHERFVQSGPGSVLCIKLEEISPGFMTNELEMLVRFTTNAEWKHDTKEEFVVKLIDCLRVNENNSENRRNNSHTHGDDTVTSENNCVDSSHISVLYRRNSDTENESIQMSETNLRYFDVKNDIKELSDVVKTLCNHVNYLGETLTKRVDCLELSVKNDISSLRSKVDKLEQDLIDLKNNKKDDDIV